ncbi:MAG: hypothetical protein JSV24_08395 [Bacteroidales bacterium]|nr:MAG: hypothetical protein JSV24_08395 [Bacteroidales bacterium]
MSASAISILVFGIYIVIVGTGFLFIPNKILPLFKFPETSEPWIRIMGIIVAIIGFYYIIAALNELTPFFWATVVGRFAILVGFILLVVTRKAQPMLIGFGVVDAARGFWTLLVL